MASPVSTGSPIENLVAAHVDLVYAAALRQVRDPHLADDVTQAVFLVLVRKMDRLPTGAMLAPWLVKVTRYTALTVMRADRRRRHHEKAARANTAKTSGVETAAEHEKQLASLLDEALMALADSDRKLIVLRYMQGLSVQETASALRLRSNTAAKRIERALTRMRRHFQRRGVTTSSAALGAAIPVMMQVKAPATLTSGIVQAAISGQAVVPAIASGTSLGMTLMTLSLKAKIAVVLALLTVVILGTYGATHIASLVSPSPLAVLPAGGRAAAPAEPDDPAQTGEMHFKVMREDGVPVASVELSVYEDYADFPVLSPDHRYWQRRVNTQPDGMARVTEPTRQPVNIVALAPGFAPLFLRAVEPYLQVLYPITLRQGHLVKGVVKNSRGEALAGVQVKAEPADLAMQVLYDAVAPVITSKDGTFQLPHMAEGKYSLTMQMPDEAAEWSAAPVELTVAAGPDASALEIKAVPGIAITGQILAPAEVDLSKPRISLSVRIPKPGQINVPIKEDKTFEIRGIGAESVGAIFFDDTQEYAPLLTWKEPVPDGFKLKREYGRIDFSYPKVGTYEGLKVEYLKYARATGRVVDLRGRPVAKVFIQSYPSNKLYTTDADGRYTALLLPRVTSRLELLGEEICEDQIGEEITLEPNEAIERNFTVRRIPRRPHMQVVSGQVVDSTGGPYRSDDCSVSVGNNSLGPEDLPPRAKPTWTGGFLTSLSTPAGADGVFTFNRLYKGESDLWAIDPKAGLGAFLADIKTGTADAKLTMGPINERVRYAGQVVDSSGAPTADVRVIMLLHEVVGSSDEYEKPGLLAEGRTDGEGHFSVEATPRWTSTPELRLIFLPPKESMAWKLLPRMSVENLKIQLKPAEQITGRVVSPEGGPVAGATVKLQFIDDPTWGSLSFGRKDSEPVRLAVITDAEGNYTLRGVAQGENVNLTVAAPGYGSGNTVPIAVAAGGTKADDIPLSEAITLEGDVRLANTGQPIAGAKVSGVDFDTFATTTTDARGHYVLSGIDRFAVQDPPVTIEVTAGEGQESLEGSQRFEYRLYQGDHIRGMDVAVDLSLSARQLAWMATPLANPAAAPRILVLEDTDPAFSNQAAYHDTLTLLAPQTGALWQMSTLNVSQTSAQFHKLAIDPKDHSAWVCTENTTGLVHVKADGKVGWQKPELQGSAVAIDPATSNAWVCTEKNVQVIDPAGNVVAHYQLVANDITYSTIDQCFWLMGGGLQKVSTSGEVIAQATVTFPVWARALAVNQSDGTVWVAEQMHPQVPGSRARLLHIGRGGQVQKEIAVGCAGLAVDGVRKVLWVSTYDPPELTRMSIDGEVQKHVPVGPACLALEPSTGYVWAATMDGVYRVGADGEYVWNNQSKGTWEKWMVVVP